MFRQRLGNQKFRSILTLKRLCVCGKGGGGWEGGGGQFDHHPCGFSKSVSSKEREKPWFFVTFNII